MQSPCIILKVLLIFRVNSLQLSVEGLREKERLDEELGKPI